VTLPYIWGSEVPLVAGSLQAVAGSPIVHIAEDIVHYIEASAEDTVNMAVEAGYSRFVAQECLKCVSEDYRTLHRNLLQEYSVVRNLRKQQNLGLLRQRV